MQALPGSPLPGTGIDYLDVVCQALIVIAIVTAGVLSYLLARRYFMAWIHLFITSTSSRLDDALIEHKVVTRACALLPLVIIYAGAGLIAPENEWLKGIVQHVALALMILTGASILDALINTGVAIHRSLYGAQEHPDSFFIHAAKAVLYVSAIIIAAATVTGSSLTAVLTGLGAMSALLLLVFRDVLLGFVSGIQLRSKDLVRRGDRIVVHKYNVEGVVIEVGLNSVIVQNGDKAYINIPNYLLVSESFTNLRGVDEASGRRIKRALKIDLYSIGFCDAATVDNLQRIPLVADYVKERSARSQESGASGPSGMTNIDVFRRYVQAYLRNHPKVDGSLPIYVRQLAPTETGVAIELTVFTKERDPVLFEDLQAEIFDHLFAVVPCFGLRMFQVPSGHDLASRA